MYKANVNCSVLKEYLDFLIKQGLVEERTIGKRRVVFAITPRAYCPEVLPRTQASAAHR
jgi:predicted transcriptional regulator